MKKKLFWIGGLCALLFISASLAQQQVPAYQVSNTQSNVLVNGADVDLVFSNMESRLDSYIGSLTTNDLGATLITQLTAQPLTTNNVNTDVFDLTSGGTNVLNGLQANFLTTNHVPYGIVPRQFYSTTVAQSQELNPASGQPFVAITGSATSLVLDRQSLVIYYACGRFETIIASGQNTDWRWSAKIRRDTTAIQEWSERAEGSWSALTDTWFDTEFNMLSIEVLSAGTYAVDVTARTSFAGGAPVMTTNHVNELDLYILAF